MPTDGWVTLTVTVHVPLRRLPAGERHGACAASGENVGVPQPEVEGGRVAATTIAPARWAECPRRQRSSGVVLIGIRDHERQCRDAERRIGSARTAWQ